jgi:hypothetical protein
MNEQAPAPAGQQPNAPAAPIQHDTSDFPPPDAGQVLEAAVTADELPEKYRGKSISDVIDMHRNAESELGRARNEVGQVRRLADELIGIRRADLQHQPPVRQERTKLTTDALLEDPDAAVTSVIKAEAADRDASILQRTAALEAELLLTRFEKKHPDFQQTMADPKFVEWVQKSPYRARLAQGAISGDFVAADELFSLFGDANSVPAPAAANPTERARTAGLVRPGGSAAAGIGQGSGQKKIWSRAELIQMRISNPEQFDALYKTEIEPAYREKRVK